MSDNDKLQALLRGDLWNEFCDSLKAAGNQVLAEDTPDDPLSRAEGFRYLTRLLRLSLDIEIVRFGFSDGREPSESRAQEDVNGCEAETTGCQCHRCRRS